MSVPRHIVAVAALVTDKQGRILMIRSPRRGWEFPGGQVEEGEDLIAALQREVREETGVLVEVGPLAGVYSNVRSHIVMLNFLCTPIAGDLQTSAESLAVEWVPRDEVLSRIMHPVLHDRMKDMLDFDGHVVYRAYAYHAYDTYDTHDTPADYTIDVERLI